MRSGLLRQTFRRMPSHTERDARSRTAWKHRLRVDRGHRRRQIQRRDPRIILPADLSGEMHCGLSHHGRFNGKRVTKPPDASRPEISQPGEPLKEVIEQFAQWIGPRAIVWSNGASFDPVVLTRLTRQPASACRGSIQTNAVAGP